MFGQSCTKYVTEAQHSDIDPLQKCSDHGISLFIQAVQILSYSEQQIALYSKTRANDYLSIIVNW